jgi:hypothetical protein
MDTRDLKQQLQYSYHEDIEDGRTITTIDYDALIEIIDDLYDKIETLERDNEFLKSYAWER